MAKVHEAMGLGPFPEGPIVDYLARSLSGFYARYGGLLIVLSSDVKRHARAIAYVCWVGIAFGILMVGVDIRAGMPISWTLSEGPVTAGFSAAMLALLRGATRSVP